MVKALGKGVLKVMSKMGISTVGSYTMAQIFEAVGLSQDLVDEYFTGTVRHPGRRRPRRARRGGGHAPPPRLPGEPDRARAPPARAVGGEYQWRREGEVHLFNPETVFLLQHATRSRQYDVFQKYTDDGRPALAGGRDAARAVRAARPASAPPVPLEEVEPVSEIVKRFSTGAMSYGSISQEAHQTLAIAMNRLGGKSNTGEGGEDPDRFTPDANGDLRRSAIKQVASGRFGVTSEYLVNADDIQIKMAQGAKPGEGGQLPGSKVYPWVARTRHSTPGRRPDQPAAAPRHLLHRGPQAAHPRPEERQRPGAGARQAGLRGRRRHGRGRGQQGPRRRRPDLRARRRHRRGTADLAQARRLAVGARPGRDPADAAGQRPARPDHRAGRRPDEDRPRRGHRRAAGRRGVRLRHRAAGGLAAA